MAIQPPELVIPTPAPLIPAIQDPDYKELH